jgi:actin, other eukaryote
VIEFGTSQLRAGLGGYIKPEAIIPTWIGRPKRQDLIQIEGKKTEFVGEEAYSKRTLLSITNPISNGSITNWKDFETLLEYTFFHDLKLSPEDHPVLFCESVMATELDRRNLAQTMFETLNATSIFQRCSSILGLYGSGKKKN